MSLPLRHIESLQSIEKDYWWFQGRLDWATRLAAPFLNKLQRPAAYLDLGCGTGGLALGLNERFAFGRLGLVDGDPAMLARVPAAPRLELFQRDFERPLALPWRADFVTCMDVIEHLRDDAAFLREVHATMGPGSLLILSVPALPELESEWDRKLGHHRRYRKRQLADLLAATGFSVKRVMYMWSFLAPLGAIRKLQRPSDDAMEFPRVGHFVNRALRSLSHIEWKLSGISPMPFGTSLIAAVERP